MDKFVKLYEEEGFTLEDLIGWIGVFMADDDSFPTEEAMYAARNDAWNFLYDVYRIACEANR